MSPLVLNLKYPSFYGHTWKNKHHLHCSFHEKVYSRLEALFVLQISFLEYMFLWVEDQSSNPIIPTVWKLLYVF